MTFLALADVATGLDSKASAAALRFSLKLDTRTRWCDFVSSIAAAVVLTD